MIHSKMTLLQLLKAGVTIYPRPDLRFARQLNQIQVWRWQGGEWRGTLDFPLTQAGLEQLCEHVNIPF